MNDKYKPNKRLFDQISNIREYRKLTMQESMEYIALGIAKIADITEQEHIQSTRSMIDIWAEVFKGEETND